MADPNLTTDEPLDGDSLDAGLAAAFAANSKSGVGESVLATFRHTYGVLRPVLLRDANGDSAHVVRTHTDAMPELHETGTRYQLSGELARGGMGAVLRGRDVDLGRDLAVKVLLEKHAGRPEVARRFFEEAQVGAQLQHPGVVPVYDIGRFGDRPFFTMKLVKGRTLSALLAERASPSDDRSRFVSIFLQVAQTLAYAHAKGVIHRDLKPANVMVGSFGEVQVMDWGLAKVRSEGGAVDEELSRTREPMTHATVIRTARSGSTGFGTDTEAGSLMGTPAYMPPEQANGDVERLDRRADVFGLGAILCEILTGQPPYFGRNSEEVRRKAANGDQTETRARLDSSGAEMELIELAKVCLAPEPMDRPRDAQAVADTLAEYLNGVQERLRQAEVDRAAAEVRTVEERRRRRVQLALATSVLVLIGLAAGTGLWIQRSRAATAARETAMERDIAAALREAAIFETQNKFAEARAAVSRAEGLLAGGGGAYADRVAAARADLNLLDRLDSIRMRQAVIDVRESVYDEASAVPLYSTAFREYGVSWETATVNEIARFLRARAIRTQLLTALDDWARLTRDPEERNRLYATAQAAELDANSPAIQMRKAIHRKDRETLASLARSDGVLQLSPTQLVTFAMYLRLGSEDATRLLRRAQEKYPSDFWVNHWLALSLAEAKPSRAAEAVGFYRAALAVHQGSPGTFLNLGSALFKSNDLSGAVAAYKQAIQIAPNYAMAFNNLGEAYREQSDFVAARDAVRKAIELDPQSSLFQANLSIYLLKLKDFQGAAQAAEKAIELNPNCAEAHSVIGDLQLIRRDLPAAEKAYRRAVKSMPEFAGYYNNLANIVRDQGRLTEAVALYRKAIELDASLNQPYLNLGFTLTYLRDNRGAVEAIRRGLVGAPRFGAANHSLGISLMELGEFADALATFRKALTMLPNDQRLIDGVRRAEKLIVLEVKLPLILSGEIKPQDDLDRLDIAELCRIKRRYPEAARFAAEALEKSPALADDLKRQHRYLAVCYAALAASSPRDGSPVLTDQDRESLRRRALAWLQAEVTARRRQISSDNPAVVDGARAMLRHMTLDPDVSALRDASALALLPERERPEWEKLWNEVAELLKKPNSP